MPPSLCVPLHTECPHGTHKGNTQNAHTSVVANTGSAWSDHSSTITYSLVFIVWSVFITKILFFCFSESLCVCLCNCVCVCTCVGLEPSNKTWKCSCVWPTERKSIWMQWKGWGDCCSAGNNAAWHFASITFVMFFGGFFFMSPESICVGFSQHKSQLQTETWFWVQQGSNRFVSISIVIGFFKLLLALETKSTYHLKKIFPIDLQYYPLCSMVVLTLLYCVTLQFFRSFLPFLCLLLVPLTLFLTLHNPGSQFCPTSLTFSKSSVAGVFLCLSGKKSK